MRGLIKRVNDARRGHPALHTNERLMFHPVDNPNLLAYTKNLPARRDLVLGVVNFDYRAAQSGVIELDLDALGLPTDSPFEAIDLLDDRTYVWGGRHSSVELDPAVRAAYLFWLRPIR